MRERLERGRLSSPLPYAVMSVYGRGREPVEVPVVELDNGAVRVQVLPSLGGRVWSMVDLTTGRELLHRPPGVFWANFGLTDAWFAGGIEWNLGSTGHATTSNLPMHAAALDTDLGPVLRLWEWERTRDLVLQVDLWLCDDRLMASTRVTNLDPEPAPLYYWTNIAVPETSGTRALSPATHAWRTDYGGRLERVAVPFPDGDLDVSVPRASRYAADYFFEAEDQVGRVVTAVEPEGLGFGETSTSALRGRKLFLWGDGPGARRWQEWLGGPDSRYVEIQAGVCTTQLEHDLLDGHDSISWTEAFGAVSLDPAVVAGDYTTAAEAARAAVLGSDTPEVLEQLHEQWVTTVADVAPSTTVHTGSGWGATELALRGRDAPPGTPFPELDDDSSLLREFATSLDPAALDRIAPSRPVLPPVSQRWLDLLTEAGDDHESWWLHFAVATARHVRGDDEGARTAYERSVSVTPTAWALRGLALLTGDQQGRARLYAEATALAPDEARLAVERLVDLAGSGSHDTVVAAIDELPDTLRESGSVRLSLARALADLGDRDGARAVLADLEVPDLAEGDTALSDVWQLVHPGAPVPRHLDFRMSGEVPEVAQPDRA